ncbi:hypothetical protein GJ496_006147 [Pomphorhynchus laevis]|nr:hypothetical protein GJ496_006147 [Pomphorhynchus laevis]
MIDRKCWDHISTTLQKISLKNNNTNDIQLVRNSTAELCVYVKLKPIELYHCSSVCPIVVCRQKFIIDKSFTVSGVEQSVNMYSIDGNNSCLLLDDLLIAVARYVAAE